MIGEGEIRLEERLAVALSALMVDPVYGPPRHVAIGANSPIPAAACWLLLKQGYRFRLSELGRRECNPFTEGSRELFDLAGQGRIDMFFLGGGQIDGSANLNLIGTGEWPGSALRFPGSFGSAFMYLMSARTLLFREEHSLRVLVPRVEHISASGTSAGGIFRRGFAQALVTGKCIFSFDPKVARFSLFSLHPGETNESVRAATGFDYYSPPNPPTTPNPSARQLALLRGSVRAELEGIYPAFCERVFSGRAQISARSGSENEHRASPGDKNDR